MGTVFNTVKLYKILSFVLSGKNELVHLAYFICIFCWQYKNLNIFGKLYRIDWKYFYNKTNIIAKILNTNLYKGHIFKKKNPLGFIRSRAAVEAWWSLRPLFQVLPPTRKMFFFVFEKLYLTNILSILMK